MAILAGKSEALARVANYSSDEDTQQQQVQVKKVEKPEKEDELMVSYKKRQEQKRKRKYNSEGSFWGIGKVRLNWFILTNVFKLLKQAPKWDGKENDIDKKDRELTKTAKSSIIPKDQLEIDQGKVKKVKSDEKVNIIECFWTLSIFLSRWDTRTVSAQSSTRFNASKRNSIETTSDNKQEITSCKIVYSFIYISTTRITRTQPFSALSFT